MFELDRQDDEKILVVQGRSVASALGCLLRVEIRLVTAESIFSVISLSAH